MEHAEQMVEKRSDVITTALLGAIAGAVGVWALDRADWFMWRRVDSDARTQTQRVRPGGEPPSHVLVSKVEKLASWTPTERQHDVAGNLVHYAIGIAPAAAYALTRERMPSQGIPRGLLFGLGLFVSQDELLNAMTGLSAKPSAYPWQAHARGLIAHLVYGVTTEIVLDKLERRGR